MDTSRSADIDGTVLDFSNLMDVELRNDNLQKCDETISAMRKQPDEDILENLYSWQPEKI